MSSEYLNNENGLLQRLAADDEEAFKIIYDHYRPLVYSWVLRVAKSDMMAQEAVQDLFLKLWSQRQRLTAISNFPGYLQQMCRHYAYDALQQRAREKLVLNALSNDQDPSSADQILLSGEVRKKIKELVEKLPGSQRKVFLLARQEDLSQSEIAARLGMSLHAVQKAMVRALHSLRKDFLQKIFFLSCLPF